MRISDWSSDVCSSDLRESATADALLKRIMQSERERKEIAGNRKIANERAKKAALHNKKLRDCKIHLNNEKADQDLRLATTLFITAVESTSGHMNKARKVNNKDVYSIKGKPLHSLGQTQQN